MPALLPVIVLLTFGAAPGLLAQSPAPDSELTQGLRQVNEGDFESGIVTLEAVRQRLTGQPDRSKELAQTCLHLGIAYLALDRGDEARTRFRDALVSDPQLRLTPQRFSPKVINAFEEVRRSLPAGGSKEPAKGKGGKKALLFTGLGAAAAAGVAVAVTGGDETVGPAGFTDARFETLVVWCPNGSDNLPVDFGVFVNATNQGSTPVRLDLVSTVAIIEESPAIPGEVGISSIRPSMVTPPTIPAKSSLTIRVGSSIVCTNSSEDGGRFNEWSARVTFTTSAGVFTVATIDRMRINIP